jgi:hypothetical protein
MPLVVCICRIWVWRWARVGAAGGDRENLRGWRSLGSAHFSPPAPGTSRESPQIMMLGSGSRKRWKGHLSVDRAPMGASPGPPAELFIC